MFFKEKFICALIWVLIVITAVDVVTAIGVIIDVLIVVDSGNRLFLHWLTVKSRLVFVTIHCFLCTIS